MSLAAWYVEIRTVHVVFALASVSLFALRGAWVVVRGGQLARWLRVVPHVIDTLLLVSGLTLAFLIHQYPFLNSDWLTAKVVGLIVYIGLGVVVFRGSGTRWTRAWVGVFALMVFAYIVSVAVTKQPLGVGDVLV